MEITYNLSELRNVAATILQHTQSKVVLFYANMGTGKTTLIKEIALQLGCNISSSPTYSIVNEYQTTQNELLYHFDFYRINNPFEVLDLGFEEYIDSGNWCFIEWPENVENLLPLKTQIIKIITNEDQTRTLTLV